MTAANHIEPHAATKLKLHNTRTKSTTAFVPINPNSVGLYSCGITAYSRAHIGNLRAYIFADTLKRVLKYYDFKVKHVENVTDVGHLTSDADTGEDKMQKSARQEKLTAWEVSAKYTELFLQDCERLNIIPSDVFCKATDYITQQIEIVKKLETKGFTYLTSDGVYFDTAKFPSYADFAGLDVEGLQGGKRVELGEKRNITDFALWKFSPKGEQRDMEWESPWGKGFPGWHIECSAMSIENLGEQFDIHTGGIDHIPVHHTNEIAQSEAATGKKPFVNFWLHSNFLTSPATDIAAEGEKISKSKGNIVDLDEFEKRWGDPLVFRYFVLGAKYSKTLPVSNDSFDTARQSYQTLKRKIKRIHDEANATVTLTTKLGKPAQNYLIEFREAVGDDLNTPVALAVLWTMISDDTVPANQKLALILDFDSVLGLSLLEFEAEVKVVIPANVQTLVDERTQLKADGKWMEADEARAAIEALGYTIKDTADGPVVTPKA